MEIKVDVNAETVNEAVSKAIIDSAIGEEMRKQVRAQLEALGRSYNSPFKATIDMLMDRELTRLFRAEFAPIVEAKIRELMTEDQLKIMAAKAFEDWMNKE